MSVLIEDDLPSELKQELEAMAALSDDELWRIARSTMKASRVALYDTLLENLHLNALTPEGQQQLEQLRHEADSLMLRKAHAFVLLKNRGVQLPTKAEMLTSF